MGETVNPVQGQLSFQICLRHKDIKKLEEGITEIHSMFMDLAILVEQQGEMVTRIEDHIMTASMDVENASKKLEDAKRLQDAARKKKVILGIIAIVVVLTLLLVLAVQLT